MELIDAKKYMGGAIKKKEDTRKMAEANRALVIIVGKIINNFTGRKVCQEKYH
jgi:SSU ribosomal protein S7P